LSRGLPNVVVQQFIGAVHSPRRETRSTPVPRVRA
jgi:hypothetical protein